MTDRTGWLSPNIFRNVEDTLVATYAANRLKHLTVRTAFQLLEPGFHRIVESFDLSWFWLFAERKITTEDNSLSKPGSGL